MILAAGAIALPAGAQNIASRVSSMSSGSVQFSYAARAGVCGNGWSYYSIDGNNFYGSFNGSSDQCAAGPVRVVVDVSDRTVVALHTYVGPIPADAAATNIGSVSTSAATDYLLSLASSSEGRIGSQALSAALLADSVDLTDRLLALARDNSRALETRRTALSALAGAGPAQTGRITTALIAIARDENETKTLRERSLSVLARLTHGDGIPALIQLAGNDMPGFVGREALTVLSRSGDPRAREYLRGVIQRGDLPDDVLATAIKGFGREYVTGRDAELLRGIFPKLTGTQASEAVLSSLGELGGQDNVKWLLGIVRDPSMQMDTRRRALQYLSRAGVPTVQLVALYDVTTEVPLKESLISMYGRLGEKASTDKLLAIAKGDDNLALRRRAISALGRGNDPAIRAALEGIVERQP
jgi:HEAT repeat protein